MFGSTGQNYSFNCTGGFHATRLLKLHVAGNIFSVLPYSRRLKLLLVFCFDILNPNYSIFKPMSELSGFVYNKGHEKSRETTREI